ncbi:MAG: thioredoxin family protein [Bacteroidia bacterium]|nr:thioredoxin family protein [Bacteroidia bacterium]MDW8347139.1 thioredoxin family protein [Bacteroidia bacterium]
MSCVKIRAIFLLILVYTLLSGCNKQYLSAYLTEDEYLRQVKWKIKIDTNYKYKKANPEILRSLSQIQDSINVIIFFGTWCSDSRKWIPKLLSIKESLPIKKYEFIAVDTTKKDEKLWTRKYGVKKLPTIIFSRDNQEIGRIVEKPKKGLERNIYKIVTEKN